MILSIIIPVLNAEKYLNRCLESVAIALSAVENDSEVIVIDNGSTDGSAEIASRFDDRIKLRVIRCGTPGAAASRNLGVEKAHGEFMWFVDSDDAIAPDSATRLINEAKKTNADLVMFGIQRVYQDGHTDYLSAVNPAQANCKSRFIRYGMGPVQLLIRRSWWLQHKFAFREGIIHEDMELMSALILFTDKMACIDEPFYTYYQNPESVLHKSSWDAHYLDIFPALEGLYSRFAQAGALHKYQAELEWFFIWNLLIDSARDFRKFSEGREGLGRSRRMLKKYFPHWRTNIFLKEKPRRLRLRVYLNYLLGLFK